MFVGGGFNAVPMHGKVAKITFDDLIHGFDRVSKNGPETSGYGGAEVLKNNTKSLKPGYIFSA